LDNILKRIFYYLSWKKISYISNDEKLWRAVFNKHQVKDNGELKSSFFRVKKGLSCDLASYTTKKCCKLGIRNPPWPSYSGIVEFTVQNIRSVNAEITHAPLKKDPKENSRENYAHCLIKRNPPNNEKELPSGDAKKLIEHSKIIVHPNVKKLYIP